MSTEPNRWWISQASDFDDNILVVDEIGLVAAVTTADDARLIAAAPTMLEALKEARRYVAYLADEDRTFVGKGMPADCLKQIDATISSAQWEAS